jgi:hypothetical protein
MKPVYRGIAVAVLHCLIVASVAGKYAWDRERLPKVWAKTLPFDPTLPVRGRYVRLRIAVDVTEEPKQEWGAAELSIADDRLVATPSTTDRGVRIMRAAGSWAIAQPSAYFIPDHVPDPSLLSPGQELWVEVSLPKKGPVRPLRLGIKQDGVLRPLPL